MLNHKCLIIFTFLVLLQTSCSSVYTNKSLPVGEEHTILDIPEWTLGIFFDQKINDTDEFIPYFEGMEIKKINKGLYAFQIVAVFTEEHLEQSEYKEYFSLVDEEHLFINLEKIDDKISEFTKDGKEPTQVLKEIQEANRSFYNLSKHGKYFTSNSFSQGMASLMFRTIEGEYSDEIPFVKVKKYKEDKLIFNVLADDNWLPLFRSKDSFFTEIDEDRIKENLTKWRDILDVVAEDGNLYLSGDKTGYESLIDYQFSEMIEKDDLTKLDFKKQSDNSYYYIIIGILSALLIISLVMQFKNKSKSNS